MCGGDPSPQGAYTRDAGVWTSLRKREYIVLRTFCVPVSPRNSIGSKGQRLPRAFDEPQGEEWSSQGHRSCQSHRELIPGFPRPSGLSRSTMSVAKLCFKRPFNLIVRSVLLEAYSDSHRRNMVSDLNLTF